MNHRKPRDRRSSRTAIGLSFVATAAATAAVAGTTSAGASPTVSGGVAVAVDQAHSRADRTHVDSFRESFQVHEYGPSVAVTAYNRAVAESVACTLDDPCRSIALSYQIVTTAGRNARLINATNVSKAVNQHCPACETFSAAYQFVVATPRAFTLSRQARSELASLDRQVDALRASSLPIATLTARADDLAHRVKAVLDREAARAPRGNTGDPLTNFAPTVTLHRHVR